MTADVIDHLAGIHPGSPLDLLRERRPDAREHAQRSYEALFAPDSEQDVTLVERDALATFVAGLHQDRAVTGHYADRLAELAPDLLKNIEKEIDAGRTAGPYGVYDEPALAAESLVGPAFRTGGRAALGERLAAGLDHAHLLIFRPREATAAHLGRLLDAGWTTTGAVTLSQLVAFLTFQIRVVAGLRLLGANR
ncbi:CMD domain protein [Nonomuraea sp. NBC_01738]|uniref:CMD domain protein n=1 Tax=Nonomuraea sp. NBC_01738 TaxID=2976003 RepID=UPI002E10F9F9|nr:CMD domain protein [Nonomuraea sp. NBC_01738]